jgi:RNA polymerase sigma factor (sigma-70 family)
MPSTPEPRRSTLAARLLGSLPGLTLFVRKRMGPELRAHESASDIVQSTCRELLREASHYEEHGEGAFQRWVRSAAEHKLQNRARHWRAQRRAGEGAALGGAEPEPAAPSAAHPSHEASLREESERLMRAIAVLSPEQQHVLRRSQIDGLGHAELGAELGRSPEAARKLVARALARLATVLEAERPPDT